MIRLRGNTLLAGVVSLVVLATVVASIAVLDPPKVQHQRRVDQRRVEELQSLDAAIQGYWSLHKKLPPNMAAIAARPGLSLQIKDPETGRPYEYEPTGERSYNLCATFDRDTSEDPSDDYYSIEWAHAAGRHCFARTIPKTLDDVLPIEP